MQPKFQKICGYKIATYKLGNSENKIIFVHGGATSAFAQKHFLSNCASISEVYTLDMPSHGNSEFSQRQLYLVDYVAILIEYIEKNSLENSTIIGHSVGAAVILETLKLKKYFNRAILLSPSGIYYKKDNNRLIMDILINDPSVGIIKYKMFKPYLNCALDFIINSSKMYKSYKTISYVNKMAFSEVKNLDQIDTPVEIHYGIDDKVFPIHLFKELASKIKNCKIYAHKGNHFFFSDSKFDIKQIL